MDKNELTQLFVDYATKMADSYSDSLKDPNFSRLLKIKGPLYSIFYPIRQRFELIDLCELYSHLHYCISDDGDMSLVSCHYQQEYPFPDIIPGYSEWHEIFVVDGHHAELNANRLLDTAATHQSTSKRYLTSYSACHMTDETFSRILDWVDSMYAEYQMMGKMRENSSDFDEIDAGIKYRTQEAKFNKVLVDHITTSRWKTTKTFSPFEISNLDKFKD